ncbi:uncharacterized protein LOC121729529 [Aricia agestis]|uniref:uncharacterized protein LOC121729529 n=1 Tax=Aricia agestis TaxID=91739 RepID=UPI001C203B4F|nr:uncharacterized protein LOC121729529 [Aricia agestis]
MEPQHSEIVIKFKPLYDKILLVLNQGPSPKTRLTFTLIASLILAESGTDLSKTEALRMYAQNMIRISGCLSALCHLFTNSMLQHETWITLCRALSEACHKSVLNQNYCSHLIPLCIERCRRSNTEVLLVLHSLLVDHHTNIKVFYESDGMSVFTRETLLHTSYLSTLNTVIEGTKPSHREYVRNSNSIFQCLRRWVLTDESGSAVTKWAVVVLYSRKKLLGADEKLCYEPVNCENDNNNKNNSNFVGIQNGSTTEHKEEFVENGNSETQDLFRNVMKEVYDWKCKKEPSSET